MAVSPIEHLAEYKLSKGDFDSLDSLSRSAISVTAFASTEVNTLMRVYVFGCHKMIGVREIDAVNATQRHVILRLWSAKLFEFHKYLNLLRKASRENSAPLFGLIEGQMKGFNELKKMTGYSFVRELRNRSTSHYDLEQSIENLEYLSDNAELSAFMHEINGNSVSPIGEEVMFIALLNKHGKGLDGEVDNNIYKSWYEWNNAATNWLGSCHVSFWDKLVFKKFPNTFAQKKAHWLPPEMVGEIGEALTPLFARVEIYRAARKIDEA